MLKRVITVAVMASQLCLATGMASATEVSGQSAEFILLEHVTTIQGEKISDKEYRNKIVSEMKAYDVAAPAYGRNERLEAALVQGQYMNQERASKFVGTVNMNLASAEANPKLDIKSIQTIVAASVFDGAQLSSCRTNRDIGVLLVAGGIISIPFIHHYALRTWNFTRTARNWSYVGSAATIASGVVFVAKNANCK